MAASATASAVAPATASTATASAVAPAMAAAPATAAAPPFPGLPATAVAPLFPGPPAIATPPITGAIVFRHGRQILPTQGKPLKAIAILDENYQIIDDKSTSIRFIVVVQSQADMEKAIAATSKYTNHNIYYLLVDVPGNINALLIAAGIDIKAVLDLQYDENTAPATGWLYANDSGVTRLINYIRPQLYNLAQPLWSRL